MFSNCTYAPIVVVLFSFIMSVVANFCFCASITIIGYKLRKSSDTSNVACNNNDIKDYNDDEELS